MDAVACLPTFEVLRDHVLKTLCGHDQLDPPQAGVRSFAVREVDGVLWVAAGGSVA